jgi:hypothetical protein
MPFFRSMHLRVELYLHLAVFRTPRILMIRHVVGVDALKHGSFLIIPRYHRLLPVVNQSLTLGRSRFASSHQTTTMS